MLFAGAFVVLDAGAASLVPLSRGTCGPAGVCEQGRDTGRIAWEPVRSTRPPRVEALGPRALESGQVIGERLPPRLKRTREVNAWNPEANIISHRASARGRRSAFIVLMTLGNSAHEDPVEEREASRDSTRS